VNCVLKLAGNMQDKKLGEYIPSFLSNTQQHTGLKASWFCCLSIRKQ